MACYMIDVFGFVCYTLLFCCFVHVLGCWLIYYIGALILDTYTSAGNEGRQACVYKVHFGMI